MEYKLVQSLICGCEEFQDQETGDKWTTPCYYHARIFKQQYDEMSKRLSFAYQTITELRWKMDHPEAK